jgi:hypothetical protein
MRDGDGIEYSDITLGDHHLKTEIQSGYSVASLLVFV